jgi:hypothetical protein
MDITKAGNVLTKISMKVRKKSPTIFIVAGAAGVVGTIVLASSATLKASKVVSDSKADIDKIHKASESGVTEADETYTPEDLKKDLTIVYAQTGVKLAKLYLPTIILGGLSLSSIIASNSILSKRNAALGAAYAVIDKSYKEYRNRVIERFGQDVDAEMKYGVVHTKFDDTEIDLETGKKKKVKRSVLVGDPNIQSDYAVYFDSKSRNYETNQDYNMMFLRAQQAYANDLLTARGHIFLNEVLDNLDLPRTQAGQIVGWTKDGPDGYVNFRILEVARKREDGDYESAILLDFNVEGNIWDKM